MAKIDTKVVWTINGIQCRVFVEQREAIYPYKHTVTKVMAEPTPKGQATDAYHQERSNLGDDFSFDLTDSWFDVKYPHVMVEAIDRIMKEVRA